MNENRVDNQLLKQPQFLSKKRMKYGPHGTVRFVKEIIKKLIPEIRTLRRGGRGGVRTHPKWARCEFNLSADCRFLINYIKSFQ